MSGSDDEPPQAVLARAIAKAIAARELEIRAEAAAAGEAGIARPTLPPVPALSGYLRDWITQRWQLDWGTPLWPVGEPGLPLGWPERRATRPSRYVAVREARLAVIGVPDQWGRGELEFWQLGDDGTRELLPPCSRGNSLRMLYVQTGLIVALPRVVPGSGAAGDQGMLGGAGERGDRSTPHQSCQQPWGRPPLLRPLQPTRHPAPRQSAKARADAPAAEQHPSWGGSGRSMPAISASIPWPPTHRSWAVPQAARWTTSVIVTRRLTQLSKNPTFSNFHGTYKNSRGLPRFVSRPWKCGVRHSWDAHGHHRFRTSSPHPTQT